MYGDQAEKDSAQTVVGTDYRIGSPDRVTVKADRLRGMDLHDAAIDAEGFIAVPTLGRVKVSGLTAQEASEALTRRVRTVDPDESMTLEISRYASRHVYTFGQVGSAGPVAWKPGMTLADALSEAGLRSDAQVHEVSVIRPGVPGSQRQAPRRVTVDFARLVEDGDASVNVALRAGDVVVVPGTAGGPAWSAWHSEDAARVAMATRIKTHAEPTARLSALLEQREGKLAQPTEYREVTASATMPVSNPTAGRPQPATTSPTVAGAAYFGIPVNNPQHETVPSDVVFWN